MARIDRNPTVGIGTFHMRGGNGSVELWSGVDLADYPVLSVTLQQESDRPVPESRS